MTDAYLRHLLPRTQCVFHTGNGVCDIVPQAVIFARMDADHKGWHLLCKTGHFPDKRRQFPDIIDFFSDNITAGHIRIIRHRMQDAKILLQIVRCGHGVSDDRQRDPAHCRKKAECHTGFSCHERHDRMDLFKHLRSHVRLYQGRIGYFRIGNAARGIAACDPQKLVLKQRIVLIGFMRPILLNGFQHGDNIRVADSVKGSDRIRRVCRNAFCKYVAVQIYFLKI